MVFGDSAWFVLFSCVRVMHTYHIQTQIQYILIGLCACAQVKMNSKTERNQRFSQLGAGGRFVCEIKST
jgi:hypothetical protein